MRVSWGGATICTAPTSPGTGVGLGTTYQRQAVYAAHIAIGQGLGVIQGTLGLGRLHGDKVQIGELDQLGLAETVDHVLDSGVVHGLRQLGYQACTCL